MQNAEKSPKEKIRAAFDNYVIFYILAVLISISFIYFVLPLVFTNITNKIIASICCFLLIPLIRAISESLINFHQFSIKFFTKQYLLALNFLVYGLVLLILAIPLLLSEIAVVFATAILCIPAFFVGIILLQNLFGFRLVNDLPAYEIQFAVKILGFTAITAAVFIALKIIRSKYDNNLWDLFTYVYVTGVDWIEKRF